MIFVCVCNIGEVLCLKMMFELGEELFVIDGLFIDFKGVVEEVLYEKLCLMLIINVFN